MKRKNVLKTAVFSLFINRQSELKPPIKIKFLIIFQEFVKNG